MDDLFETPKQQFPPLPKPTFKDPDPTVSRHRNNPQSDEAHRSTSDQHRSTVHMAILHLITDKPSGATCDELEQWLNLRHQTCSARVTEMLKDGRLKPMLSFGIAVTRKTRSGRKARVYILGKVE